MLSPMNLKALDLLDHLLIINRYCLLNDLMKCTLYLRKGSHHLMFDNNFGKGKWGPIFEIISPTDLWENSLCTHTKISISPAICCYTTLWKSKIQKCYWFWQHPQQTVDMFLRTLWTLDLTFDQGPGSRVADGAYAHPTIFVLTQLLGQPKKISQTNRYAISSCRIWQQWVRYV